MCVLLSVRVRVCVWGFRSWRLGYKSDGMETLLHVARATECAAVESRKLSIIYNF